MKICFLGPATSAHIIKWCNWFVQNGHEVHVISFLPAEIDGVHVHLINAGVDTKGSDMGKLKYLLTGKQVKKIIEEIKPNIVNAHFATSYGMAVALSGVQDYYLSVWGADIYDFPKKSPLHKALLKYSLKKAGYLFSTSQAMADEAAKYTKRMFSITPFGVDLELFNPCKRTRGKDGNFIVGTVKGLKEKYGISLILNAVSEIKKQGDIPIRLRIAGKGPEAQKYYDLAEQLGIDDITTWLGFISQEQAAEEWANMDVAIIPSTLESESFGVSAVEAQACGTPVIISDIPGLMEATDPGESSIVVRRNETEGIVTAIRKLYEDEKYREKLGLNGVAYVQKNFELNRCFENVKTIFEQHRK